MPLLQFTPEQTEALRRHLERAAAMWRQLAEVFREIACGLARTAMAVADFVQRQSVSPAAGANRRPAWMSPYGPPPRGRHRRR